MDTESAEVVNDERIDTAPPLWPSDHAGVVATLVLGGRGGGR